MILKRFQSAFSPPRNKGDNPLNLKLFNGHECFLKGIKIIIKKKFHPAPSPFSSRLKNIPPRPAATPDATRFKPTTHRFHNTIQSPLQLHNDNKQNRGPPKQSRLGSYRLGPGRRVSILRPLINRELNWPDWFIVGAVKTFRIIEIHPARIHSRSSVGRDNFSSSINEW
jgi:hypothetical protein